MTAQDSYVATEVDSRLEQFDQCWDLGNVPFIEDYLPDNDTLIQEGSNRSHLLIELVMVDLEYRWKRPARLDSAVSQGSELPYQPVLEDYLRSYPELQSLQQLPTRLIAEEYRVRHRWGNKPSIEEYLARFPNRDSLRSALLRVDQQLLRAGCSHFNVECPHCRERIELAEKSPIAEIACPHCQGTFRLVADSPENNAIRPLERIGRFELLEIIGEGSFGVVWKGRDTELDRIVAIKIPRKLRLDVRETEEFLREARAAAQLVHPNIVSVHDARQGENTSYIVSDYIAGQTLTARLTDTFMPPHAAAEIAAQVAEALHHAHERGVIHRDLKPSNVLLDARDTPLITDFGLAKREEGEVTMTVDGKLLGTPAYMSPEQARGETREVDRRTDVYALGVVLFEMLTGERPFQGSVTVVLHRVLHDDAPSPRQLNRHLPRDIETICLRCLERDKRRRYATAKDVADDLRRFLANKPVRARSVTRVERAYKWCRRNPVVAALSAVLVVSILCALTIVGRAWHQQRVQHYVAVIKSIADAYESGDVGVALRLLDRHRPRFYETDLRGFEWYYLLNLCQPALWAEDFERESEVGVFAMDVSPEGRLLAAAGGPGTVIVWDMRSRKIVRRLVGHEYVVVGVAFSPDGRTLATSGRLARDGVAGAQTFLWDVSTWKKLCVLPRGGHRAAFSPDGNILAACDGEGIVLWNVADRSNVKQIDLLQTRGPEPRAMLSCAFSPDGALLAAGGYKTGGNDAKIRLWNISDRTSVELPTEDISMGSVWSLDFFASSDEMKLVSGGADRMAYIWDVSTRNRLKRLEGHTGEVTSVRFSPDGKHIVSGAGMARVWDAESGKLIDVLRGHEFKVWAVDFLGDAQSVVTGSLDGVKRWDLSQRAPAFTPPFVPEGYSAMALFPDGNYLAAARRQGSVVMWHLPNGEEVATFSDDDNQDGDAEIIWTMDFSHDGKHLACATKNRVRIWDVASQSVRHELAGSRIVAFSPNSEVVATVGPAPSTEILLCKLETGELIKTLRGIGTKRPGRIVFSPDGRLLAAGGESTTPRNFAIWDMATGEEIAAPKSHLGATDGICFSADGRLCCTGGGVGEIILWNTETWTQSATQIEGRHTSRVGNVAFSPDGKTLASASEDGLIKLWHVETGGHLLTLEAHNASVESLEFSGDGQSLVSYGADGTIQTWRAATGIETRGTQ